MSLSRLYGVFAGRGKRLALALAMVAALPAAAEPMKLVALGDSLTQGYGLVPEQGFVPQLQAWLEQQGAEAEVINAGVSGDTTAGGLARIGWTLSGGADALIVALGGNDLLRGIAPEVSRANIDGILAAARDAAVPVLLVGMEAPGNYGADYKAAFDAIYPELADSYGALHVDTFFAGLVAEVGSDDPAALRGYFQPDGIHPNADGVARIVEGLGPVVLDLLARATP